MTDHTIGWLLGIAPFLFLFALLWIWPERELSPFAKVAEVNVLIAESEKQEKAATGNVEAYKLEIEALVAKIKKAEPAPAAPGGKPANTNGTDKQWLDAKKDGLAQAERLASEAKEAVIKAEKEKTELLRTSGSAAPRSWHSRLSDQQLLFLAVAIAGAFGAAADGARGYAYHIGRGDYDGRWRWWYFLRIPMGICLAVVTYLVLRAAMGDWNPIAAIEQSGVPNPYGHVAVAALAGMFANEAHTKLKSILESILTKGEAKQPEKKPSEPGATPKPTPTQAPTSTPKPDDG